MCPREWGEMVVAAQCVRKMFLLVSSVKWPTQYNVGTIYDGGEIWQVLFLPLQGICGCFKIFLNRFIQYCHSIIDFKPTNYLWFLPTIVNLSWPSLVCLCGCRINTIVTVIFIIIILLYVFWTTSCYCTYRNHLNNKMSNFNKYHFST